MPRKVFVAGEILTAADVNTNLMDQAVMSFAGTAARGSAIPSPVEGMAAYLNDSNIVSLYDGSDWKNSLSVTGGILQVVSTTKTDTFTSASTSFVDVTGLSATITPKSTSSNILILVSVSTGISADTAWAFRLARGATGIALGAAAGSRTPASIAMYFGFGANGAFNQDTAHLVHLDSPSTTSATTYVLQARSATGTITVNRMSNDGDANTSYRTVSSMTVMEVAG